MAPAIMKLANRTIRHRRTTRRSHTSHPSRRTSYTIPHLPSIDDFIKREIQTVKQFQALPGNLAPRLGQRIRAGGVIPGNQPILSERTQRRG